MIVLALDRMDSDGDRRSVTRQQAHVQAKLAMLGLVGLYVVVLMWAVSSLIAPRFDYQGYVPRDASLLEVLVVLFGTVVIALTLPSRCRWASQVAQLFLVLTVAVPVLWVPLFYGPLNSTQVQNLALATTACFVVIWSLLGGSRRSLVPLRISRTTFWLLMVGFLALAGAHLLSLGLIPRLVMFSDVYSQRASFVADIDVLGAYLVGWLAGGTIPVLFAVGLYQRNAWLIAMALVGVLYLYSLTGQKSFVIGVVILVGTFWMTRRGTTVTWHWLSLLAIVIVIVGVADRLRGGFEITSLLVRRAISTAGINTAYFVDAFDGGPFYELRHSVLSFRGSAPYDDPPARHVGTTYYTADTAANANFMADGFANFGWWGMLAAALVVGVLLRLYDRVSAGLPLAITAPALVFVLLAMANTAILTVVASHGAAVLFGWVALLSGARHHASRKSPVAQKLTLVRDA